jgi:hypothetical protein
MQESISVPNSGSFENKENTSSQMGHANKKYIKNKHSSDVLFYNYRVINFITSYCV